MNRKLEDIDDFPDLEEVVAFLASMRRFGDSLPEGLGRRVMKATANRLCDFIEDEIATMTTPGASGHAVAESVKRLHNILGKLREWLLRARAFDLAQRAERIRAGWSKGGYGGAKTKKDIAATWQTTIQPEVERLLAAGRTDWNIANRVAPKTADEPKDRRDPETVRKFVAKVRKELTAKKK